jgi:Bax protein
MGVRSPDTLKGIMLVNNLTIADDAVFRDEPIRFLVGAEYEARAVEMCTEIEQMRTSGELANIIGRMHLE